MTTRTYVIQGPRDDLNGTPLFWSNIDGWVDIDAATVYTDTERMTLRLPVDGTWTLYETTGGPVTMDTRVALQVVTAWVDDASSFVQMFDAEDLGDPTRPIAEGSAEDLLLGEALRVLGEAVER